MEFYQPKNIINRPRPISSGVALMLFVFLFFGLSLAVSAVAVFMPWLVDGYAFNMVSIILTQFVCMLPPVLIVCHAKRFDFLSVMRLRKGIDIWQILLLLVVSGGFLFFGNGLNNLFVTVLEQYAGYTPTASDIAINTVPQLVFAAFIYGTLPAFCEEFFFRGLVLRSFGGSRIGAVLISALLFGLMHGNLQQVFFAFMAGCLFAVVVEISDSLLPAMLLHFLNNAIAMVLTYFQQDAPAQEVSFGIIMLSGIITAMMGAVILGGGLTGYILYTRYRNKKKYGKTVPNEYQAADASPQNRTVLAWILIAVFIVIQCGYMAMDLLL